MSALLQVRGIERRFGPTVALAGVDREVGAGEVLALIGENGAGKSTLMNILSGSVPPDAGEMSLAGQIYAPRGPGDARSRGVAHIHQELSLCPHLSVAENVRLGSEPSAYGWVDRDGLASDAASLLREFGRGEIDPWSRTADLSLSDRQIVEICRALAWNARVLLMDEPTSSLQRSDVDRLFRVVRRLRDRGIAILYVSHFLEEVREIADRYTVLRDGIAVASGDLVSVRDEELIAQMAGRRVETVLEKRAGSPASPGDAVLEVRDLAAPPRLRSASFDLFRGEVLGIAGLIGSGRTDLVRVLFGLMRATAGRMRVRGEEVGIRRNRASRQIQNGFGFSSEDRGSEGLAPQLSIADNVTISRFSSCARVGWIDRARQRRQTEEVMRRLRVKAASPQMEARRLSGGNQQKLLLGRLLHQDPEILLLDEPARGIDVASKADIYREIARLASEGKAILMVSSSLPELLGVCDRIAVMSRGRLSPARPASEWTADTILQAAIGGTAC